MKKKRQRQRGRETSNTYDLKETTLKITLDYLCQISDRRFQDVCRIQQNFTRDSSKNFKWRWSWIESVSTHCNSSRQKINLVKRHSVVRTNLKYRAWRSSCGTRHNVERDMSSDLFRRSSFKNCRDVSFTSVSISIDTSIFRHRFSERHSSDASRSATWAWSWYSPAISLIVWQVLRANSELPRVTDVAEWSLTLSSHRHVLWYESYKTWTVKCRYQKVLE